MNHLYTTPITQKRTHLQPLPLWDIVAVPIILRSTAQEPPRRPPK